MCHLQIIFLLSFASLTLSFKSFHIHLHRPQALISFPNYVVANEIDSSESQVPSIVDTVVSKPIVDVSSSTAVAPAINKGFGKSVATEVSDVENAEKGKRSEAKKKYQQDRKLEKSASTLGKMMGTGKGSNDQRFKNQSYI